MLYAAHLGMYLLEHLCSLLQAKDDVLLDLGELDVGRQLLELLQLAVCLGEERLLVLLAAEGEQGALLVALGQHLLGDLGLAVGEDGYAPLVLVQLVALGFEVEDGPLGEESMLISYVLYSCDWGACIWGGRALRDLWTPSERVLVLPHLSWAVTRLELLPMVLLATCRGLNQQY